MPDAVAELREFSRFYTGQLGVFGPRYLATSHTLAEARVLFELAQSERVEVSALRRRLRIDAGHLSRLLSRLERRGLVERERSPADGRRQIARLTAAGARDFAVLDRRSDDDTAARLAPLDGADRRRLVAALAEARRLLERAGAPPAEPASKPRAAVQPTRADEPAIALRAPRAGELGWIVQRHGEVYAEEFGWDASFEAYVARIVADYAERRDPEREAAWIAEVGGAPAGCVLCVRHHDDVAMLRLLLVEPRARGLGLGERLVGECIAFARGAGYRELTLWTNDVLVAARRIYKRLGFTLVDQEPHRSFGHDLVGENWSLGL